MQLGCPACPACRDQMRVYPVGNWTASAQTQIAAQWPRTTQRIDAATGMLELSPIVPARAFVERSCDERTVLRRLGVWGSGGGGGGEAPPSPHMLRLYKHGCESVLHEFGDEVINMYAAPEHVHCAFAYLQIDLAKEKFAEQTKALPARSENVVGWKCKSKKKRGKRKKKKKRHS